MTAGQTRALGLEIFREVNPIVCLACKVDQESPHVYHISMEMSQSGSTGRASNAEEQDVGQGSCLCPGAAEGTRKEMDRAGQGVRRLGHTGLLGRVTAEMLGSLPSEAVRSPRVRRGRGEGSWSERSMRGPQSLKRKVNGIPAPSGCRCFT